MSGFIGLKKEIQVMRFNLFLALCFLVLIAVCHPIELPGSDLQSQSTTSESSSKGSQKSEAPLPYPVYKPPLRGMPDSRVGGSDRGSDSRYPLITALVPRHTGATVMEQPVLYWHLSRKCDYPIEITILDDTAVGPLWQTQMSPPIEAGIHKIRLSDGKVRLAVGKTYKWFVAIIIDSEHRSKDIVAGGDIERISLSSALQARLSDGSSQENVSTYAEAGIWYDALNTLNDMIAISPDRQHLKAEQAHLLKQVGIVLEEH